MLSWVFRNRARLLPIYTPALRLGEGVEAAPRDPEDDVAKQAEFLLAEFEAEILVTLDREDPMETASGSESTAESPPRPPGVRACPPLRAPKPGEGKVHRRARYTVLSPMRRRSA